MIAIKSSSVRTVWSSGTLTFNRWLILYRPTRPRSYRFGLKNNLSRAARAVARLGASPGRNSP